MNIAELFEKRKMYSKWNTSYPLAPKDWKKYRTDKPLSFMGVDEVSFYIHIPFCKQLCSFCEYTRMICPNEKYQEQYINTLRNDIRNFLNTNHSIILKGFDIGGGTPTALSEVCFEHLLDIYDSTIKDIKLSLDFEPSIEATFSTLSERKLKRIVYSGIKRLSLGVQSSNSEILCSQHRERISNDDMMHWIALAKSCGIEKVNLDLMYGLSGMTEYTIEKDLELIKSLSPEQVTLYELRTNMIDSKILPTKHVLWLQYNKFFDGLIKIGYHANYGQNTFSKNISDEGVSSYLRSRMLYGTPYKGFGISAQSMSLRGISYNIGKSSSNINAILGVESFERGDTYLLPPKEMAAKYIAIAAYNGAFSVEKASDFLNSNFLDDNLSSINFCIEHNLVTLKNDKVIISKKGFEYYGAVFSLFYNPY